MKYKVIVESFQHGRILLTENKTRAKKYEFNYALKMVDKAKLTNYEFLAL